VLKAATEWKDDIAGAEDARLSIEEGRQGELTAAWEGHYLHSRYRPSEEAARLVDSAELDLERPVLVIGLGLGYHVRELLNRGVDVAAAEHYPAVAKAALEGPLADTDFPLAIGSADEIGRSPAFRTFAQRNPQVLVHPASAHIAPGFAAALTEHLSHASLAGQRLGIAVVGPLYGGSLPIAESLARAFENLGHRTLYVDNSIAWNLYDTITGTVKSVSGSRQLGDLVANALNEWSYARIFEFRPDIVIALAQAPLNPSFNERMRREGIVTAYWFVENWRHMTYWQSICREYDTFMHIQPGEFEDRLTAAGCRDHIHVQTGCDPEAHKPVDLTEEDHQRFQCDLSFAGAGYYNRQHLFLGLTDYDFKIWGVDWEAKELGPLLQNPQQRFSAEKFSKICAASKIVLNLHSSTTYPGVDPDCDAINPRVFDIAATGAFQLCDACIGLDRYFDTEHELPTYRNLHELRDKIDYYLTHDQEREAIAQRAHERALKEHTYEHRAQQMLDHIISVHGSAILRKGVRVQRTIGEIAAQEAGTPLGEFLSRLPKDRPFNQETLNELIANSASDMSEPERIFSYLDDMRRTNEALFEERESCAS